MEQLAIPLSNQKTIAKWLVITASLQNYLLAESIIRLRFSFKRTRTRDIQPLFPAQSGCHSGILRSIEKWLRIQGGFALFSAGTQSAQPSAIPQSWRS
jgi:hypothetical protein